MVIKYFSSSILTLSLFYLIAQNPYKKRLDEFVSEQKQEKIYLHFDRPQYAAGEHIWLKAYVTNATSHLPTDVSSTLHIELINQQKAIIDSITLFIEDGITHGSLLLRKDLKPGSYRVRAYTEWMRNCGRDFFYRKDFTIINPSFNGNSSIDRKEIVNRKLSVDFLPEGGDLIDGISTKVGIKATDITGKNVPIIGTIVNDKGEKVAIFESDDLGYALCFIRPKIEDSYLALIQQDTFQLPTVKNAGATIRVIHSYKSDDVSIAVQSKNADLTDGTLVIHRRGQFLFSQKCLSKKSMAIRIKKSQLKAGIIHLTFFDKNQTPLSERLIFPNPPPVDQPNIVITPDRDAYAKRSKVSLKMSSENDIVHSASITISPQIESPYESNGENIENYLLLDSDLRGRIESPGSYFMGTKEAYKALDLLMLTHGWSRFNWTSLLEKDHFTPKYQPEEGLKIHGRVINHYTNKNLKEPLIGVSIPSIGVLNETFSINNDGTFQIAGLKIMDSTRVYLQAYKEKNERVNKYEIAKIILDYPSRPILASAPFTENDVTPYFVEKTDKLRQISKAYFMDSDATTLDEVVVTAKSIEQDEIDRRTLYSEPSNRIILDSLGFVIANQSIFDLLRRVPGVTVSGGYPNQSALVRGLNPSYFLDGIPVDSQVLQTVPTQFVEFIDVLKGPKAVIYGSRGSNGVILVYTKRGGSFNQEERPTGLLAFLHPGYHKAKEFYSPQYEIDSEEHIIPDFRTTLFWTPELKFENNEAEVTFYSSDQTGNFIIRIEGMFSNGRPFFEESFINVE